MEKGDGASIRENSVGGASVGEASVCKASIGGAAIGGALIGRASVSYVKLKGSTADSCSPCACESSCDPSVAADALPLPPPRPREGRYFLGAILEGWQEVLDLMSLH